VNHHYAPALGAGYCFGVDLGGTKVSAAIGDLNGRIVAESTEPTDQCGAHQIIDQIAALARRLALSAGVDVRTIRSVMVGIPGVVDPHTGNISLAPNIKSLADLNVLQCLKRYFGPEVALENDVNLAILGEHAEGHARGLRNCAFLSLGTGAGLGLLIDGNLVRGASGAAGEIGYLPIGRDTTSLAALTTGAFELEVGSLAIVQQYKLAGRAPIANVRDVFSLLQDGDAVAEAVLDATARSVALGVTALQAILDLEVIVLGGSIGARPELVERIRRAMPTVFARPVNIARSQLGTRAGLIGAVRAAASRSSDHAFANSAATEGSTHVS
jgi:predicted NBD/HSP70 family sugar kinase